MAWVTLTTSAIPTHWPAFLVSRAVAHVAASESAVAAWPTFVQVSSQHGCTK